MLPGPGGRGRSSCTGSEGRSQTLGFHSTESLFTNINNPPLTPHTQYSHNRRDMLGDLFNATGGGTVENCEGVIINPEP